ncbi:MAG: 50S ribosomal protein L29 [Candidatus Azobacteroides sp.]|nr:50S ribosomal protein L29 [Candidatus Azobacteroides sp.]
MKIAEIKELKTKELQDRIDAETANLNQKKINHSVSPLDSPAVITKARKDLARMKTEMRQRELKNQ